MGGACCKKLNENDQKFGKQEENEFENDSWKKHSSAYFKRNRLMKSQDSMGYSPPSYIPLQTEENGMKKSDSKSSISSKTSSELNGPVVV